MTKLAYYNLPDVGEGLTEAEIVSWKVAVGDTVTVNQIVVEIETAKSLVELPVPFAGVVSELLAKEGDTVEVGKPIISVTVDDNASSSAVTTSIPVIAEAAASAHQAVADAAATVAAEEKSPTLVGYGVSHSVGSSRRRRPGPGGPELGCLRRPAGRALGAGLLGRGGDPRPGLDRRQSFRRLGRAGVPGVDHPPGGRPATRPGCGRSFAASLGRDSVAFREGPGGGIRCGGVRQLFRPGEVASFGASRA